jgi:hypothetical protein
MEGGELTPAADVFAVAVLLMELWNGGKPPFRRRTNAEIEAAMRASHPKPSDANVRLLPLDEVIGRAMSLDPRGRPQQADDLARALRKFLAGVDLGDLARQLGDRVRFVRAHPPQTPVEAKALLQRPPSRPTSTQVGTRTFAARDELGDWHGPQTRRLASGKPPPDETPPADSETLATRPLETDPRKDGVARRRGRVGLALGGAAGLAAAAFFLGRGAGGGNANRAELAPAEPSSAAAFASPSRRSLAAEPLLPSSPPSRPSRSAGPELLPAFPATSGQAALAGPPPAPSPSGAGAPPLSAPLGAASVSSPSAVRAADRAWLVLLGEGTVVTVDGISRGPAPAKVAVEPGAHAVLFSFPATGEYKGESITLGSGDHTTLRADFTGATPTIRLLR